MIAFAHFGFHGGGGGLMFAGAFIFVGILLLLITARGNR